MEVLRLLLSSVQKANNLRTFAQCYSCRFNQKIDDGYLCELTQESLTEDDVVLFVVSINIPERAATDKR